MAVKVFRNLDAFTAQFVVYNTRMRTQQREAVRKSTERVDRALDHAAARLTKKRGVLKGVGKGGATLSHRTRPSAATGENTVRVVFSKQGPWQLRDSSVRGGPTRPHILKPNFKKSPRPMDPAKQWMPSMKSRQGEFYTNYNKGLGPFLAIEHPGSKREPAWANAIESVMPVVIKLHSDAFRVAGYSVFG